MTLQSPRSVGVLASGNLFKLGGGAFERLQERYFELHPNGELRYFESKGGEAKGTVNVIGAKVVDRGTYMGKLCFTLEGLNLAKGQKEYFLFADEKNDKWKWYQVLQKASGRYKALYQEEESSAAVGGGGGGSLTHAQEANLSRIRTSVTFQKCVAEREDNLQCADCGAAVPTWAVLSPFCVFVCIDCVGVHRSLWAGKCKEIQLDSWTDEDIQAMLEKGGNKVVNQDLEFHVAKGIKKPNQWSPRSLRETFISHKYNSLSFSVEHNASSGSLPAEIDTTTAQDAHHAAMSSLGSPPRYIGVAFVNLIRLEGFQAGSSVVAALTNGFQEVRSKAALKAPGGALCWNQSLQIGVDILKRPLYVTLYDGDKIHGTAELVVEDELTTAGSAPEGSSIECRIPVFGKGVPGCKSEVVPPSAEGSSSSSAGGGGKPVSTANIFLTLTFNRLA